MKVSSFLRSFSKRWFGGPSGRPGRRTARELGRRPRRAPLHLDHLEDRTLLAAPPAPNVIGQQFLPVSSGDNSNPVMAVDPLDSQKAVAVWVNRFLPVPNNPQRVFLEGAYTTNAG